MTTIIYTVFICGLLVAVLCWGEKTKNYMVTPRGITPPRRLLIRNKVAMNKARRQLGICSVKDRPNPDKLRAY